MVTPDQVLTFWLDEVGPKGWYQGSDNLDAQVRNGFEEAWEAARHGAYGLWLTSPKECLAYIILTDQFPRNMFRGKGRAFAADRSARAAAKLAVDRGWDLLVAEPERQFFYMPLMHSENLVDQDRCVRLMSSRMTEDEGSGLRHACAHRHIIRTFGRFPYRNAALDRASTPAEAAWMDGEGYAGALRAVDAKAAS